MKKRRGAKKSSSMRPAKSPLSGAMRDLELEIGKLSREKSELKSQIQSTGSAIDVDREKEKELQNKIAALIEKEAQLNQRKKNLQTKIDRVADKMNKVSKIKSEMADI